MERESITAVRERLENYLGINETTSKVYDRVVVYNPDAIGEWVLRKYDTYLKDILSTGAEEVPVRSVMPSVTPVCFASMYSGMMPNDHGIQKYEKPVLKVDTLFDAAVRKGLKVAIVSTEEDSISEIFLERPIDYFIYPTTAECNEKALELIAKDYYNLIVLYNADYDSVMHKFGPESKEALAALKENVETFKMLQKQIRENYLQHDTVLVFAPDHGCHEWDAAPDCKGVHGADVPEDMEILHFYCFEEMK